MVLTDELQEAITPFIQGKLDLLDRMDSLRFSHLQNGIIAVQNWYNYSKDNMHGDCGELAVKGYQMIKENFPSVNVTLYWGFDNGIYDMRVGLKHAFLIAQEKKSQTKILVDPAQKIVEEFDTSGYTIMYNEDIGLINEKIRGRNNHLIMQKGDSTFYAFDPKTEIAFYLERPPMSYENDVFGIATHRAMPEEVKLLMPVDTRHMPISPCPKEVRNEIPPMELAYQLNQKAMAELYIDRSLTQLT